MARTPITPEAVLELARVYREQAAQMRAQAARLIVQAKALEVGAGKLPGKGLVAKSSMRHDRPVTEQELRQRQAAGGRLRRKTQTAVHAAVDAMGWPLGRLAQELARRLGRPVSRASVQLWAAGEREIEGAGGARRTIKVTAPKDVREAAEALTGGRLKASDWPNAGRP